MGEVVVDHGDQLLAELLEGVKLERVHDGQTLTQHLVAQMDDGPGREVVGVRADEVTVAEEVTVGVVEDRAGRHLFEALDQLPFALRPEPHVLQKLDTPDEDERSARLFHDAPSCSRSATGKLVKTASRNSAGDPSRSTTSTFSSVRRFR